MVPQFLLEVHRSYRRKIREPDDPPSGPDGRVLRAVRGSARKGSGLQGERGPSDHPRASWILPRIQSDLSGRICPVLGIEAAQKRRAISMAWLPHLESRDPEAYGSSRLSRDSSSARHSSALRLKFAFANRPAINVETNSSSGGGFPSSSQTTRPVVIRSSPSRKPR